MRKVIISLILLLGLNSMDAGAAQLQLQENLPERYTVVSGDTLWGIASRYLKDPWRWSELWGMNRQEIANPHWIYPGDVIVLQRDGNSATLKVIHNGDAQDSGERQTVRLSPSIQTRDLGLSIPSIPRSAIEPFLAKTRVVDAAILESAPKIVASVENRVILGAGNRAFVSGLPHDKITNWQVFRSGKELVDPATKKVLGAEADYLGDARLVATDGVSTVEITRSVREIAIGDRLLPVSEAVAVNYVPHAPEKSIQGQIIAAVGDTIEIARNSVVTINRGSKSGLEVGNVLAVYRAGETVGQGNNQVKLPDEREGLVFVFRTFENISYALVVQSERIMHSGDQVRNP